MEDSLEFALHSLMDCHPKLSEYHVLPFPVLYVFKGIASASPFEGVCLMRDAVFDFEHAHVRRSDNRVRCVQVRAQRYHPVVEIQIAGYGVRKASFQSGLSNT